jgi:hypothetical protein
LSGQPERKDLETELNCRRSAGGQVRTCEYEKSNLVKKSRDDEV